MNNDDDKIFSVLNIILFLSYSLEKNWADKYICMETMRVMCIYAYNDE